MKRIPHADKYLISALTRLLAAFETDAKISPGMTVKMSVETNGAAIAEAREALRRATPRNDVATWRN